ncbi:hypothetical protein FTO70_03730 [Methanosarcina sp. KYL-1]|uniref:hypothetical protein n=1 Tax=Methanosarcina sp. KYL-1 TaxID=2602068 RepID=UPI00210195E8|nr:hypothetical protein [Methanosarcina sp. KYL-1]MCQ1534814.1 hypothetical protein [Methanosarcina sp. KYL-1]
MFIKAHCPVCGTDLYQNIRLHALEHLHFEGDKQAYRYAIESIDVTDTLTEEELIRDILKGLHRIIHDGIEVEVLAGILEENYGVTGACCRGLIEMIQVELDMYCPDMKRLYFVDPEGPGELCGEK